MRSIPVRRTPAFQVGAGKNSPESGPGRKCAARKPREGRNMGRLGQADNCQAPSFITRSLTIAG